MKQHFEFSSARLDYTGLTQQDTPLVVKWRSDKDNIKYFYNTTPATLESHTNWFLQSYQNSLARYDFVINEKQTNQKIGIVFVSDIDFEKNSCEIGYSLFEASARHKGYGGESVLALIAFCEKQFNLKTFIATIHKDNISSKNLIKKCGFSYLDKSELFENYILEK